MQSTLRKILASLYTNALARYPHIQAEYTDYYNQNKDGNDVAQLSESIRKLSEPLEVVCSNPRVAEKELNMASINFSYTRNDLEEVRTKLYKLCEKELASLKKTYPTRAAGMELPAKAETTPTSLCRTLISYESYTIAQGMMG